MPKNLEISVLLDFYGEMLTEKQRDYLGYYYNDDLSLGEISQNEGSLLRWKNVLDLPKSLRSLSRVLN